MKIFLIISLSFLLFFISYYDIKFNKIKNLSLIPIFILYLFSIFFNKTNYFEILKSICLSICIILFFLFLKLITNKFLGTGDIKLISLLSMFLYTKDILYFVLFAFIFAFISYLFLKHFLINKSYLPLAPYICISFIIFFAKK